MDEKMCPKFEAAIELFGKRWTGLIVRSLLSGPKRFKEISQIIEQMSDRMLSERLKELEAAGIVLRRVYNEVPVRIEYELTEKGRELRPMIEACERWANKWME